MTFEPDTSGEIFDTLSDDLQTIAPETYPNAETTLLYAILQSVSQSEGQLESDLSFVYDSAYLESATDDELTKKARNFGFERQEAEPATGVVTFQRDSAATSDYTIQSGTIVETVTENVVQYKTTKTVTLSSGTSEVDANVVCQTGGTIGNVAAGAIQSMPSKPTGVDSVTNQEATGDPSLTDTNGDPLVAGQDRETDSELRSRALGTDATKAGPDGGGIKFALQQTDGVISTSINTNQTGSTQNGLNPYYSEVIVYGGAIADIADTLYNTISVTDLLRLQGGVNGTKEETTITSDILQQQITIPITRPSQVNFDLTIDVVHTVEYQSDDIVVDEIVNYIGGTDTSGKSIIGLSTGDNVLVNEIENRVEDVLGVDYADVTLLDTDSDGSDDTTTDGDGVPILSISGSEIPRLDAANVTVNTTQR